MISGMEFARLGRLQDQGRTPLPRPTAALAFLLASLAASPAMATPSVSVDATASLYGAGGGALPSGSTTPVEIAVPTGATTVTFSASGSVTLNSGGNYSDPDGIGAAQGITVSSDNNISGIILPWAGALTGVFLTDAAPGAPAPTSLDYTTLGTGNPSYAPAIAQTFFIGDGLTGDGVGTTQLFYVPTGATRLFLGYTDACGYSGPPGCYGDNSGTVNASYLFSPVPEPASFAMLGTSLIGMGLLRRKR